MVAFITILVALIMIPFVLNWLWNRYNPVEQDKQGGEEVDEEFLTPTESENLLSPEEVEIIVGEIKQSLDDDSQGKKSDIRYSISFDESLLKPTFQEMLLDLINEKNVYHIDFYKAAWIDRKLFSAIMNNKYYKPKKTTAVACCLGLRLSLLEATRLMEAAGYSLSESILWDVIIRYCIEHEIYDINQVNQILDAHGEKCIGC